MIDLVLAGIVGRCFHDDQAVEHADVLKHFGGAVPDEAIAVTEAAHEDGPHIGAHRLERFLCGAAHPPVRIAEESGDVFGQVCSSQLAQGASRVRAHKRKGVCEQLDRAVCRELVTDASQRLDRRLAHPRVGIVSQAREVTFDGRLGVLREQRGAPQPENRIEFVEQRAQPIGNQERGALDVNGHAGGRMTLTAQRVEQDVHRPRVGRAPQNRKCRRRDIRIGIVGGARQQQEDVWMPAA